MKKNILYVLVIALCVFTGIWWGALAVFLLLTLGLSLVYYSGRVRLENWLPAADIRSLFPSFKNKGPNDEEVLAQKAHLNNQFKRWLPFLLLTTLFIFSCFILKMYLLPGGRHPYFTNTDHHSIDNSGIAFDREIVLFSSDKGGGDGVWESASGKITARPAAGKVQIDLADAYIPLFGKLNEDETGLLNPVYKESPGNNFKWLSDSSEIHCIGISEADSAGWLNRMRGKKDLRLTYRFAFRCKDKTILEDFNRSLPFADTLLVTIGELEKGISLYDLFLENPSFKSRQPETRQLLEAVLADMGDAWLLTRPGKDRKALFFFPGADFIKKGYRLEIGGRPVAAGKNSSITVDAGQKIFAGFYNSRKQFSIGPLAKGEYPSCQQTFALLFDFPDHYSMKAGMQSNKPGLRQARFLQNHFSQLPNNPDQEGFLFNESMRPVPGNLFSGQMVYTTDLTGIPLQLTVTDERSGRISDAVGKKFVLGSQNGRYQFLFTIRDFSENDFSFAKTLTWLAILYLVFLTTCLFNPGRQLERLEPVIYAVIYAFLTYRFILLWRLATFPPLENIGRHELEETLLHFDVDYTGLPLSFLAPLLLMIGLNVYRRFSGRSLQGFWGRLPLLKKMNDPAWPLLAGHGTLLLICFAIVLIFPGAGRLALLLPLLSYLWFSNRIAALRQEKKMMIRKGTPALLRYIRAFTHYWTHTPHFWLALATLLFFALTDKGFMVLFLLFLLLKNILISFLRKPSGLESRSLGEAYLRPDNYWVFGLVSFFIYLLFIGFRPLFYFLLQYKLAVLGLVAIVFAWILHQQITHKKWRLLPAGLAALLLIALVIPFTRQGIDGLLDRQVKYVAYRASVIFKPLEEMVSESRFNSFEERKIIETAESQWFINSYLGKEWNRDERINLRPHFNQGVNYSTQTRDVVLPRFIQSEAGTAVVYLLLALLALPMVLYLLSYRISEEEETEEGKRSYYLSPRTYGGALSLLFLFTTGFFVWLTSTNRFVFFGQDFPFLSLTSRLSLLLPLSLLLFTLTHQPLRIRAQKLDLRLKTTRFGIFFGILILFILISGRSNQLRETNFRVNLADTERTINQDLNKILSAIQDSIPNDPDSPGDRMQMIGALRQSAAFKVLYDSAKPYTQSLLDLLVNDPGMTFRPQSPVYLRYDADRYRAEYNRHLYLELPAYEGDEVWTGNIYQQGYSADSVRFVSLRIGKRDTLVDDQQSFVDARDPTLAVKAAFVPGNWLLNNTGPMLLVNVANMASGRNRNSQVQVHDIKRREVYRQDVAALVTRLHPGERAQVFENGRAYTISLDLNSGATYMRSMWVNGRHRMVYPLGEKMFWVYHYAHAAASTFNSRDQLNRNTTITLDYNLSGRVHTLMHNRYRDTFNDRPRFKFAAIAADGDGRIRLMADFVKNRQLLDPNDIRAVQALERQHFFYSNNRDERDQWGNTNLLHLMFGPGSSIKPLMLASAASQVDAGWEDLKLNADPADVKPDKKGFPAIHQYAGLLLPPHRAWKKQASDNMSSGLAEYIYQSNNYYHSLVMFLGAYKRSDFTMGQDSARRTSLAVAMTQNNLNGRNNFPRMNFRGQNYYFQPLEGGKWPKTSLRDTSSYFGNEESVMARGLSRNLDLVVEDNDKSDYSIRSRERMNYADTLIYDTLRNRKIASFLWSFPEESQFIQADRSRKERVSNFLEGLKTPTLGGSPMMITPLKMAEMYGKLASGNRQYRLHITERNYGDAPWVWDSSWRSPARFDSFLQTHVLANMRAVLTKGTAKALLGGKDQYNGFFLYAKTGTIAEGGKNMKDSKRLALIISKNDLTKSGVKDKRFYVIFFTANLIDEPDWTMYRAIIDEVMNSDSFKKYMR